MDTTILFKTKKSLKRDAQKVAADAGIPLSTVLNSFLRKFVEDRSITLSAPMPNARTIKALEQAERDYKTGKNMSPAFDNAKDAIAWLKKQRS